MPSQPIDESLRFPVEFDLPAYLAKRKGEILPRAPFEPVADTAEANALVVAELARLADGILREPAGKLAHHYVVPGGPYHELWDWDAFFTATPLARRHPRHFLGCLLNLLDGVREDGHPPKLMTTAHVSYQGAPYPLHAQWAVMASRVLGDWDWVRPRWETLLRVRAWHDEHCAGRRGLYRVLGQTGHDNDPCIYGRPPGTVASVEMNCLHQREHEAMSILAGRLGEHSIARDFAARALALREAINFHHWDPIDGMFYHLDMHAQSHPINQGVTWELPFKVRHCATLWPLWTGIADPEKARRVIDEHLLDPGEFLSPHGIRSLARNERMYNNEPMGNPSNWQGPVWGHCTFINAHGLARMGRGAEARDVAGRLLRLFAGDLRANGVLHEMYHGDTGAPVMKPGFLSWNMMALTVMEELGAGVDPYALRE